MRLTEALFKYYFKTPRFLGTLLSGKPQVGGMSINVSLIELWRKEPFKKKTASILKRKYEPSHDKIIAAQDFVLLQIMGAANEFAPTLLQFRRWQETQDWNLNTLTDHDQLRAESLGGLAIIIRNIHHDKSNSALKLNLLESFPFMIGLLIAVSIKMPILSIRNYLDINLYVAFNSIRKSKHPKADELISYLYEISFIQQKIASALYEFLSQVTYTHQNKKNASLINSEINAIMGADLIFTYLKASIEKTIVLIALTYGINGIENRKTHKQRINYLESSVPEAVKEIDYFKFIMEFISSENLEELNNYRSGILHKRGIADLQPHNFIKKNDEAVPFTKIFETLHEQHVKNTAVLICALALLTDKLVELNPPAVSHEGVLKVIFPDPTNLDD